MAILASMFAYLAAVGTVIVALLMSFDAFLYAPNLPPAPQSTTTIAAAAGRPPAPAVSERAMPQQIDSPYIAVLHNRPSSKVAKLEKRMPRVANVAPREPHQHLTVRQIAPSNGTHQQAPTIGAGILGFAEDQTIRFGRF